MPSLSVIHSAVAELPNGPPIVAAFAGGTTGIGSYVVRSLAKAFSKHGSKLRVYIVGRNISRAESVIADGKQLSPGSDWHFVHATDLALISEVDRACEEIIRRETESPFHGGPVRLDLLYMSHAYHILKKQTTTKEGLDAFLSTVYYSRIRFTMQLLPLLTASPRAGHVVSIYAGGFEDGTSADNIPIGCPPPATYGISSVRKHTCFMKNFVFEDLAEKHAGHLSLSHIYPGLVEGPGFHSPEVPTWLRVVWRIFKPMLSLYMTSPEDCGTIMLYLASPTFPARQAATKGNATLVSESEAGRGTDGEPGSGSYAVGRKGDTGTSGRSYDKVRPEGIHEKVWNHTMETLEQVAKQNNQAV